MRYLRLGVLGLAILMPSAASGSVINFVNDPQKEQGVAVVQDDPKVKGLRTEFDALARRMHFWKERDFEAVLGRPVRVVPTDYALTCTQARLIITSGIMIMGQPSKEHTEAYAIGDGLRVDVYYQRDGVSPNYMIFYLRTGSGFVRLDRADQLEARVTWERAALWKALKHLDERWRAVVGWEVNPFEFDQLFAEREALDPAVKLSGYSRWGKKEELRLVEGQGNCQWYRGNTQVASMTGNGGETPTSFTLFGADGRAVREHSGNSVYCSVRWNRPDGSTARSESWARDGGRGPWRAITWHWPGPGGRGDRLEEDTNGDGIPDQVTETTGTNEPRVTPLKVEQSWAIRPELIPTDWRVADQPDRRLPVRKIAK